MKVPRSDLVGLGLAAVFLAALLVSLFHFAARPPAPSVSPSAFSPSPARSTSVIDWPARLAAARAEQMPDLVRELVAEPVSPARDLRLAELLSHWIRTHPGGLRAFLDEMQVAEGDDALPAAFFEAVATALPHVSDHAASSAYLAELIRHLVAFFAESDPARALDWANQWLLGDALDAARVAVLGALARQDPAAAKAELARITGPLRRVEALAEIGESLAAADADEAIRWARTFPPGPEQAIIMNRILEGLTDVAPERAVEHLEATIADLSRHHAELAAAERIARGVPAEPQFDANGQEILVDAEGEPLPPKVSSDLELLADSARMLAFELAAADPSHATRWLETLPDSYLKTESTRALLSSWAETQPEPAYRYYEANLWFDAEPAVGIFSAWAAAEPATAAIRAQQITSPRHRQKAIEGVVEGWGQQTGVASALTDWIANLPVAAERDQARRTLARLLEDDQPEASWQAAAAIVDAESRAPALKASFVSLVTAEPDRARTVLAGTANLSSAERAMLQAILVAAGQPR